MATYECEKCGMSVNATCGHCDAPLENDTLELGDGNEVLGFVVEWLRRQFEAAA